MPRRRLADLKIDPADGKAYTKQSFIDHYGDPTIWDLAGEVLRIDTADGKVYNKQSFIEQYHSTAEWNQAESVSSDAIENVNWELSNEDLMLIQIMIEEFYHLHCPADLNFYHPARIGRIIDGFRKKAERFHLVFPQNMFDHFKTKTGIDPQESYKAHHIDTKAAKILCIGKSLMEQVQIKKQQLAVQEQRELERAIKTEDIRDPFETLTSILDRQLEEACRPFMGDLIWTEEAKKHFQRVHFPFPAALGNPDEEKKAPRGESVNKKQVQASALENLSEAERESQLYELVLFTATALHGILVQSERYRPFAAEGASVGFWAYGSLLLSAIRDGTLKIPGKPSTDFGIFEEDMQLVADELTQMAALEGHRLVRERTCVDKVRHPDGWRIFKLYYHGQRYRSFNCERPCFGKFAPTHVNIYIFGDAAKHQDSLTGKTPLNPDGTPVDSVAAFARKGERWALCKMHVTEETCVKALCVWVTGTTSDSDSCALPSHSEEMDILGATRGRRMQAAAVSGAEVGVGVAGDGGGRATAGRRRRTAEYRIDPGDNEPYTKAQFIDYYGDTTLWDKSEPAAIDRDPGLESVMGAVQAVEEERVIPLGGHSCSILKEDESLSSRSSLRSWPRTTFDRAGIGDCATTVTNAKDEPVVIPFPCPIEGGVDGFLYTLYGREWRDGKTNREHKFQPECDIKE